MNKTITYGNKQPCPKCKDTDHPCVNCGRVHAEGLATISEQTSELTDTLIKLLDRSPESKP